MVVGRVNAVHFMVDIMMNTKGFLWRLGGQDEVLDVTAPFDKILMEFGLFAIGWLINGITLTFCSTFLLAAEDSHGCPSHQVRCSDGACVDVFEECREMKDLLELDIWDLGEPVPLEEFFLSDGHARRKISQKNPEYSKTLTVCCSSLFTLRKPRSPLILKG